MSKSQSEVSSSQINFKRALDNLKRSTATPVLEHRDLSGIIKDFEMAYELSWKVLKKILKEAGNDTLGAKDVYTQAYRLGYIKNESAWLKMIEDRNQTSHVYDEESAKQITERVRKDYLPLLTSLLEVIK